MDYWADTMQDDCYLIASEGWKAETYRVIETDKKGKEKDKGWMCDLIPKALIVARSLRRGTGRSLTSLSLIWITLPARLAEMEEEHGGEDGAFAELDKVNKANCRLPVEGQSRATMMRRTKPPSLNDWLKLDKKEADPQEACLKEAEAALDGHAYALYPRAHRVRDQDACGGRQVARRSG